MFEFILLHACDKKHYLMNVSTFRFSPRPVYQIIINCLKCELKKAWVFHAHFVKSNFIWKLCFAELQKDFSHLYCAETFETFQKSGNFAGSLWLVGEINNKLVRRRCYAEISCFRRKKTNWKYIWALNYVAKNNTTRSMATTSNNWNR